MNDGLEYLKRNNGRTLYNFCSAKKIYLTRNSSRELVIRESNVKPVSLLSRDTVLLRKGNKNR